MAKGGSGAAASKTGKRKQGGRKASKIGGANKKLKKAPRVPKNRSAGKVPAAKAKKARAKSSKRGAAARKVKVPPRRVRK